MNQLIPFDQSKGGHIPNLCLDNVRRGYGIGNNYASAWEAWQHTEQHPDRNIPSGLDVPLYYSYTTTIDEVTQNYGHINVQLADGTVWSDGNIYANLDAYLVNHSPKFVGWGESINNFKIIQGETMSIYDSVPTPEDRQTHYQKRLFRDATPAEKSSKSTWGQILDDNVTELGKRLQAAEITPPEGYVTTDITEAGQPLFKKG